MSDHEAFDTGKRMGAAFVKMEPFGGPTYLNRVMESHRASLLGNDRWAAEYSRGFLAAVDEASRQVSPQIQADSVARDGTAKALSLKRETLTQEIRKRCCLCNGQDMATNRQGRFVHLDGMFGWFVCEAEELHIEMLKL